MRVLFINPFDASSNTMPSLGLGYQPVEKRKIMLDF